MLLSGILKLIKTIFFAFISGEWYIYESWLNLRPSTQLLRKYLSSCQITPPTETKAVKHKCYPLVGQYTHYSWCAEALPRLSVKLLETSPYIKDLSELRYTLTASLRNYKRIPIFSILSFFKCECWIPSPLRPYINATMICMMRDDVKTGHEWPSGHEWPVLTSSRIMQIMVKLI